MCCSYRCRKPVAYSSLSLSEIDKNRYGVPFPRDTRILAEPSETAVIFESRHEQPEFGTCQSEVNAGVTCISPELVLSETGECRDGTPVEV